MKEDGIIESRFVFVCARKSVDNKKYTTTVTTAISVKQHVGIRGANNTKQTRSISSKSAIKIQTSAYICVRIRFCCCFATKRLSRRFPQPNDN